MVSWGVGDGCCWESPGSGLGALARVCECTCVSRSLSACVCPGVCMEARPPHAPWLTQAAASLPACPSEVIAIFSSLRSLASGGSQGLGIPLPGCLGWCRWELPQGCQAFPGSWLPWTPHPQPPTAQCLQAGQPGTSGTETQGVHPLCPPRSPSPVGRGLFWERVKVCKYMHTSPGPSHDRSWIPCPPSSWRHSLQPCCPARPGPWPPVPAECPLPATLMPLP